ncbi:MAG: radical SAM protein [Clostridia bacterium]|nr:radical SAM protein [Clostridia bacterium]
MTVAAKKEIRRVTDVAPFSEIPADFPYRLDSCVWEITLACCFRCAYCGSSGGRARENELSTEECLDTARQLHELGCRRVSMIGGEVFMRRDWAQIVEALTSRGIAVCVITNGFSMTPAILEDLRRVNIESVAVSLDGPEAVHDAYRQKGSFARAIDTIRALTDADIPTSVISALRADNAPRLPELYGILREYPIFAWQIQACSPMGNASENRIDVKFDAGAVLRFVKETATSAPFAVGVADNIGYFTPEETESGVRGAPGAVFTGCGAGLCALGIDSVGNVRGCESMYDPRFNEGNLRERSLASIWYDPDAFAYNRKFDESMLTGKCARCEYGSVCAGGCRSYNWFAAKKLYENPLCARET